MGSEMAEMKGYVRRGNDVPGMDPNEIIIIGGPGENDLPYSDEYKAFYCPRASEIPDEAFVATVREPNRVYDTIHCVKIGKGADSRFVVVGHRRCVKAARIVWNEQKAAGVPEPMRVLVRVQVHANLKPEQVFTLNVQENNSKKSLTAMQKAKLYEHAATAMGMDTRSIAAMFNVAQSAVVNTLAMLKCAPEVQAMFCEEPGSENYIAAHHAPAIAALASHEEQVKMIAEMRAAGVKTTGTNVRAAVKAKKERKEVSPVSVTHSRSRSLVEKVRAEIWQSPDQELLDIEASGELTERDRAMIAMALEWQMGKTARNAAFRELTEKCLGTKAEIAESPF